MVLLGVAAGLRDNLGQEWLNFVPVIGVGYLFNYCSRIASVSQEYLCFLIKRLPLVTRSYRNGSAGPAERKAGYLSRFFISKTQSFYKMIFNLYLIGSAEVNLL